MLDSGRRPPPSTGFSFNMIDTHRALLLGGRQGERRVADMYIFDFDTRVSVSVWYRIHGACGVGLVGFQFKRGGLQSKRRGVLGFQSKKGWLQSLWGSNKA